MPEQGGQMTVVRDFILWALTNYTITSLAVIGVAYGVVIITLANWLAFGDYDE